MTGVAILWDWNVVKTIHFSSRPKIPRTLKLIQTGSYSRSMRARSTNLAKANSVFLFTAFRAIIYITIIVVPHTQHSTSWVSKCIKKVKGGSYPSSSQFCPGSNFTWIGKLALISSTSYTFVTVPRSPTGNRRYRALLLSSPTGTNSFVSASNDPYHFCGTWYARNFCPTTRTTDPTLNSIPLSSWTGSPGGGGGCCGCCRISKLTDSSMKAGSDDVVSDRTAIRPVRPILLRQTVPVVALLLLPAEEPRRNAGGCWKANERLCRKSRQSSKLQKRKQPFRILTPSRPLPPLLLLCRNDVEHITSILSCRLGR